MLTTSAYPILYSFRRCPYAMRARLAIAHARKPVWLREVALKAKPAAMLELSPKATVPVLVLPSGRVIDESLDIMYWALTQNSHSEWLAVWPAPEIQSLIRWNDGDFKYYLDHYKYADRYPDHPAQYYRQQGEGFLTELESRLQKTDFLAGDFFSVADAAIAPFIRQFAAVDDTWFSMADYPNLRRWLTRFLESPSFKYIMSHYRPWQAGDEDFIFGDTPSNCSN